MRAARSSSSAFWFDRDEAERAVFFIEEYCRHVKGPRSGKRLVLERWQRDLVADLFGWKRADGLRRYRFVWLEVPRKAGKTTLAAAIGLYMLMVDRERGAEIVVAAGDINQASICFNIVKDMVAADRDLSSVCRTSRRAIRYKDASINLISGKHETKHGSNVSCLLFDEVYTQSTRELHDTLITGMAARAQPLTLYLTTAGWDRTSLAWELHDYASKVRDGVIDDPTWLVSIFGAGIDDDWSDPEVWRRAHPGIGNTISEEFLRQECNRAQQTPGFVSSFRRLYLNVWTESTSRWLDMNKWDECGRAPIVPDRLRGRECYAGLDLSSTTDLSALVLVFRDDDGGYTLLPFAFCPEEAIKLRSRRDKVDYTSWRDQRLLIATPGNAVDHAAIRETILSLAERYRIRALAFDRWNSSMLISQLLEDGMVCVPVGQGGSAMNGPARELERHIADGTLRHGGHPVLRWCAANTIAEMNAFGEIKPAKNKSTERIDLVTATLMALSRYMVDGRLYPSHRPPESGPPTPRLAYRCD